MTYLHGTSQPSLFMRVLRAAAYACIGTAGILLLISPVFMADANTISVVMTWFFIIGGFLSAAGSATTRWVGEFTGLPLLAVSFLVFGAITYRENVEFAPYLATANLLVLGGIGLLFLARWRYVLSVFHAADRLTGKADNE